MEADINGRNADPGQRPLERFSVVQTRDPDEAREAVGRIFCPHRLTPVGRSAGALFDARHHTAAVGALTVNYVAYGARVEIDPGCLERFYLLQIPLLGAAQVTNGGRTAIATPRDGTLLSPRHPTRMIWEAGCEKLILLIPRAVLEHHLERVLDYAPRSLAYDHALDLAAPRGAAVLAQARLLQHLVESGLVDRGGVFERELGASLTTLLIGHLMETGTAQFGPLRPRGSTIAPVHVRRAEAYIAAHLDAPLALPDLAGVAGSSVRALQEAFRSFRQTTVSDFILAQRLERWRNLIQASPGGTRVGDLALSVGLNHLGRAAAAYRARFSESPSQTRRARR